MQGNVSIINHMIQLKDKSFQVVHGLAVLPSSRFGAGITDHLPGRNIRYNLVVNYRK